MSDDIKSLNEHVPKSRRAAMNRPTTDGRAAEMATTAAMAMGKKLYGEITGDIERMVGHLAEEHKAIFEIQEAAFQIAINRLHGRIQSLENHLYQLQGENGVIRAECPQIREIIESLVPTIVEDAPGAPADTPAAPLPPSDGQVGTVRLRGGPFDGVEFPVYGPETGWAVYEGSHLRNVNRPPSPVRGRYALGAEDGFWEWYPTDG